MGIEPTPSAWKAEVLPLNYTRLAPAGAGRLMTAFFRLGDPSPGPCGHSALTVQTTRDRLTWNRKTSMNSNGGGGRIRTFEGISRQIYSLLPLAAWVPLRGQRAAYSQGPGASCQCALEGGRRDRAGLAAPVRTPG